MRIEYKDSFNKHTIIEIATLDSNLDKTDKGVVLIISKENRVTRELLTKKDAYDLGMFLINRSNEQEKIPC